MNWDHPDHEPFKELRDNDPTIVSWEVARPLVQKQIDGHPLTEVERIYLERFYSSNVCQEFFCRLKVQFAYNAPCWLDKMPTEEQCSRCALHYASKQALEYAHSDSPILGPEFTPVTLYSFKDDDNVTRFSWKATKDKTKGIVGEYIAGVEPLFDTPLDKIFPVCIPSLSPQFDNKCDHNCAKCPAYGYYDSLKGVTTSGLGNVKLSNKKLPEKVVKKLEEKIKKISEIEDTEQ